MREKTLAVLLDADGCYYNYKFYTMLNYVIFHYGNEIKYLAQHPDMKDAKAKLQKILAEVTTVKIDKTNVSKLPRDASAELFKEYTPYLDQLKPDFLDEILWCANERLIQKIQNDVINNKVNEIIFLVGSARQSMRLDKVNSDRFGTRSFFLSLERFVNMIKTKYANANKINCYLDTFLMSDVHGNVNPGESFRCILAELRDHLPQKQYETVFDRTKFTGVYGVMHYLACKYKDKYQRGDLILDYFDDSTFIRDSLKHALINKHANDLLPRNIPLYLCHYTGYKINDTDVTCIFNKGNVDPDYGASIRKMLSMSSCYINPNVDVANNLNFDKYRKTLPADPRLFAAKSKAQQDVIATPVSEGIRFLTR